MLHRIILSTRHVFIFNSLNNTHLLNNLTPNHVHKNEEWFSAFDVEEPDGPVQSPDFDLIWDVSTSSLSRFHYPRSAPNVTNTLTAELRKSLASMFQNLLLSLFMRSGGCHRSTLMLVVLEEEVEQSYRAWMFGGWRIFVHVVLGCSTLWQLAQWLPYTGSIDSMYSIGDILPSLVNLFDSLKPNTTPTLPGLGFEPGALTCTLL